MVEAIAGAILRRWLEEGLYRGWLVERGRSRSWPAEALIVSTWTAQRGGHCRRRRATILNVYTEPAHRRQGAGARADGLRSCLVPRAKASAPSLSMPATTDARSTSRWGSGRRTQMRLDLSAR